MITLLNRKELLSTYKIEEQAKVRDILSQNNVDYHVHVVNRKSPSPMNSGSRIAGTFGENLAQEYEYIFYVKKADYDEAMRVLKQNERS